VRLSEPEAIAHVGQLLQQEPGMHRTALADRLCDDYGFVDARGQRQRSTCLKVLRSLAGKGRIVLPAPQTQPGPSRPRRLTEPVLQPQDVPDTAGQVRGLSLVVVETAAHMRIWNELMLSEHPRGAGPLVGRQLRYLVGSAHGWLGGLALASAALQLQDRDRWIGWDVETRRAQLDRVVGLSRFLIRPSVRCQNLASRVLGLAMQALPADFEARYGYQPWLVETFVDTSRFAGTCFQAANWIRVGSTQGRGRQDAARQRDETVKDIYVRPLVADFRQRLGLPPHSGRGPLPIGAGLEAETWAQQEFGDAPLGDHRLSQRLVRSAQVQADHPGRAFSGVMQAEQAMVKGYYRMIDQPDDSAVTMEHILQPHREQTVRRMQAQETVLCIQDGTDLDYNGLAECEGLGVIGKNQTGAQSRGLHLHTTLAVGTDGVPLGVLRAQCWAPTPRPEEDQRSSTQIPIEEKETFCWIRGLRDGRQVAAQMPHTRLVMVADREADIFELFDEWRQDPSVDLLVRASHNRRTSEEHKLLDAVRATQPRLRLELAIGRQTARPKRSKQKARPARQERTAQVVVRYQQLELRPPKYLTDCKPVSVWAVLVTEEDAPAGVTPIQWCLLTTLQITSPEQAEQCLAWYCLRWRIEDWTRVLKSGCQVEDLAHETAERLKRAIAIRMVIAWRIMLMTLLGRQTPELPADLLFSDLELKVLEVFAATRKDLLSPSHLPAAVLLVAKLGGYLNRKGDPPPGNQLMWQGYTALQFMCLGAAPFIRGP
jgi:hypothetical protein